MRANLLRQLLKPCLSPNVSIERELATAIRLQQGGDHPPRRDAALAHYTLGGSYFDEYRDCEFAQERRRERQCAMIKVVAATVHRSAARPILTWCDT